MASDDDLNPPKLSAADMEQIRRLQQGIEKTFP